MNKVDLGETSPGPQMNAASQKRFDAEGDWMARQFFSAADLQMSPEEYAARKSHLLGCFGLHLYQYRDPNLGAWVRRLGEIFESAEEIDRCRKRYLSADELKEVHKQEQEDF